MRYRKLIFVFLFLLLVNFVLAEEVLETLDNYYQYAMDEDIENYMAVQDPYFLPILQNNSGIDIKTYYEALFEVTDVKDYEIVNPSVFEEENSAVVYYRLKGTYVAETEQNIENDMVAFLWKYDDWKVRWTMTRNLYDQKVAFDMISDIAVIDYLDELDNTTLKSEMIAEGYPVEIEDTEAVVKKAFSFGRLILYVFIVSVIVLSLVAAKNNSEKIVNAVKIPEMDVSEIVHNAKSATKKIHKTGKKHVKKVTPKIEKFTQEVKTDIKEKNIGSSRLFFIFWAIVAILVIAITRQIAALFGVIIAAVISYVLWKKTVNSEWEGKIEKIKTEKVLKDDFYQNISFAYVKLKNGKTKKLKPHPDWKEGDIIRKEKGKFAPEKVVLD